MNAIHLDQLHDFIVRAKRAAYVGGGQHLLSYRQGSHDLQFMEGEWAYHDSYFGGTDFIGQETVYFRLKPLWAMNYYGRILADEQISGAQAGAVIKESLTALYREGRFLGGWRWQTGEYEYEDWSEGTPASFTGQEVIRKAGEVVYRLVYHGGLIRE